MSSDSQRGSSKDAGSRSASERTQQPKANTSVAHTQSQPASEHLKSVSAAPVRAAQAVGMHSLKRTLVDGAFTLPAAPVQSAEAAKSEAPIDTARTETVTAASIVRKVITITATETPAAAARSITPKGIGAVSCPPTSVAPAAASHQSQHDTAPPKPSGDEAPLTVNRPSYKPQSVSPRELASSQAEIDESWDVGEKGHREQPVAHDVRPAAEPVITEPPSKLPVAEVLAAPPKESVVAPSTSATSPSEPVEAPAVVSPKNAAPHAPVVAAAPADASSHATASTKAVEPPRDSAATPPSGKSGQQEAPRDVVGTLPEGERPSVSTHVAIADIVPPAPSEAGISGEFFALGNGPELGFYDEMPEPESMMTERQLRSIHPEVVARRGKYRVVVVWVVVGLLLLLGAAIAVRFHH